MKTLSTAQVAAQAGVGLETVRFYERRGLLPEPPRRPSGYRLYDERHVDRIRFIRRAQDLGFTLDEIGDLLSLRATPEADRSAVRARTEQKIHEVDAKIRDLQQIRSTLEALANACHGHGPTDDCPILQALDGMSAPAHVPSNPVSPRS